MAKESWSRIGPKPCGDSPLGVVFVPEENSWTCFAQSRDGISRPVGSFSQMRSAILARDVEIMRIFGLDATPHLNFSYDVCASPNKDIPILRAKLFEQGGGKTNTNPEIIIHLYNDRDLSSSSSSSSKKIKLEAEDDESSKKSRMNQLPTSEMFIPTGIPGKTDLNRKWSDRLGLVLSPPSAFIYEITFTEKVTRMGMLLKQHYISCSSGCFGNQVACCVVGHVGLAAALQGIVYPGDILLKLNEHCLLGGQEPPGTTNLQYVLDIVRGAPDKISRTLRLLRCAGTTPNLSISAAEARILAAGDAHYAAKFTIDKPLPNLNHEIPDESIFQSNYLDIQVKKQEWLISDVTYHCCSVLTIGISSCIPPFLSYFSLLWPKNLVQCPLAIKKMMGSMQVSWESAIVHQAVPPHGVISQVAVGVKSSSKRDGVYLDRGYWWAVFTEVANSYTPKRHFIGKFSNEDDAALAYNIVSEEFKQRGIFSRWTIKRVQKGMTDYAKAKEQKEQLSRISQQQQHSQPPAQIQGHQPQSQPPPPPPPLLSQILQQSS